MSPEVSRSAARDRPLPGGHEHLERREVADDLGRREDATPHDEVLGAADPRHAVDRGVELEAVLAVVGLGLERRPRAGRPLGGAEERLATLDVHRPGVEHEVLGEQRAQRVRPAAVAPGVEVRPRDPGGVLGAHPRPRLPAPDGCVILKGGVHRRRASLPRAGLAAAPAAPSREPARDPLLDRARGGRVARARRGPGRVAGRGARRPALAAPRAGGHGGRGRRARGRHAALALRGAPLGGGARGGLHAVGLVRPGAPHRARLAHPDRRHPARAAGAALRPGERDRDDRLGGGRARDQGARPRGRRPPRRRADRDDGTRRGGRDVTFADAPAGWRRLDARMLLVHPVHALIRAMPWLFGLIFLGTSNGKGGRWALAGLGFVVLAGMVRWFTTSYRVTPEHVQLRSGLLRRRERAVALDRVRTVDVTANAMHRILGLRRVTIGTGRTDRGADAGLQLDGLDAGAAARLRDELLHGRAGRPIESTAAALGAADAVPAPPETELARLHPRWIAYGPCTLSGLVTFAVALSAVVNAANDADVDLAHLGPLRSTADALGALGPALAVVLLLAGVLLAAALFAAAGYVLAFWGFRLTRRPEGTLHVVRGLITTRAVTIEERRLRGVELAEPLLLRAAGGARCAAIATGLRAGRGAERGGSVLVPPGPRGEARRVAADVLRTGEPVTVPLAGHGPRARRRRFTRALVPAAAVAAAGAAVTAAAGAPAWATLWLLLVVAAAALAADRARSLGHAITPTALVARAGSLVRRRAMLSRDGIIGVNVSRSFFQRRAGLVPLTAPTAAGDQAYRVLDVTPDEAVRVAQAAAPGLLAPFLESA